MKPLAAVLLVLLTPVSIAAAQTPPPPPSCRAPHQPHEGFFFRAFLGMNRTSMPAEGAEVCGRGGSAGLAVGWAAAPNLMLVGELFDDVTFGPTVKLDDVELETYDTETGTRSLSVGSVYYFMSMTTYVSFTLAGSKVVSSQDGHERGHSRNGVGASFMLGKEWWIRPNWGLGVALQLNTGRMKDHREDDTTWTARAAAVVFSATYN